MLIPLSVVDDVALFDLEQQHPRTHNNNNMLPVFVLFDSRTMSHYHHPTTPPSSSSHHHNNLPTRLMSHNRNNSVSSTPTFSVVDETLLYHSHLANNIPRRSRIHPTTQSFNHGHPHHHNNGTTRASAAVVMDVQEHVTTSTEDAVESICSICLLDLPNASSTPIRLRCSHVFHTHCIQKWINIRKNCPLCRANV
ncbi:E3 ubiquitin-protein ligase At3g02290-like [Vicia villosa]|uniref:E3 ubiquitin-protein ligase At3g02290-like n=1 Tax=Vicia villosa TaxID=3911 RepID=UPI00273B07A4|nr:E3 ubiquitin-protein ligase At3g02290-like [Vicia villosa]XP_058744374.1 E3 ubiquitin-protein ligase At3g02290-like [Vicia villosa]